jgi:hypothetical protein
MGKIKNYQEFTNEEINLRKSLAGAALGAGLSVANPVLSQDINTTSLIKPSYKVTPYDSSTNYVKGSTRYNFEESKANLSKLLGQTLFLKPQYVGGELSYDIKNCLSGDSKNKLRISSDSLVGKYFIVEEIQKGELYPVLKLRLRDTEEIYYYNYELIDDSFYSVNKDSFPFIIGGFYIKQSQLLSGSELIISKSTLDNITHIPKIIKNGKKIGNNDGILTKKIDSPSGEWFDLDKLKLGTKFKFIGLVVDVNQTYSPLCLVFENGENKILVKYDDVFDSDDEGTGISYPSSYYTYNININFTVNVNIYR